jgi:hypothetical protein
MGQSDAGRVTISAHRTRLRLMLRFGTNGNADAWFRLTVRQSGVH